jgi:hypothetical protein
MGNTTKESLTKTSLGVMAYESYVYTTTYTYPNLVGVYTLV